jgi:hypothetical protein
MVGIVVFCCCLGGKSNIQTHDLIFRGVAFAETERTCRGKGKLQEVCYAHAMNLL